MRFLIFAFLLIASKCCAQTEAIFKVSKPATIDSIYKPAIIDSTHKPLTVDNTDKKNNTASSYASYAQPPLMDRQHYDTLWPNNLNTQVQLNKILQLPIEINVISCDLFYTIGGQVTKVSWSINQPNLSVDMQRIIDAYRKGHYYFSNIVGMKNGQKLKLKSKTLMVN